MRVFVLFVWVMMVCATGFALFHITFQVEALEGRLSETNRAIIREREAIHVLKAEWTYLNRPQRVESLARTLLPELQRQTPEQVVRLEDIPMRDAAGTGTLAAARAPAPGVSGVSRDLPQDPIRVTRVAYGVTP